MREQVIQAIEEHKLIAILRGIPGDKLIPAAEALYQGGIRLLELTYSADGCVSDEETAKRIESLVKHFGERMYIGAGTVLTAQQVRQTCASGGSFIISPDTFPEVIQQTVRCGIVSIPGALTPSEITAAHRLGADFVKVFPVSCLGAAYVKALKAPLSHIRLLAVGGIDETNMGEYLKAGVCGFGIGSGMVSKTLIDRDGYGAVTALAEKFTAVIGHG